MSEISPVSTGMSQPTGVAMEGGHMEQFEAISIQPVMQPTTSEQPFDMESFHADQLLDTAKSDGIEASFEKLAAGDFEEDEVPTEITEVEETQIEEVEGETNVPTADQTIEREMNEGEEMNIEDGEIEERLDRIDESLERIDERLEVLDEKLDRINEKMDKIQEGLTLEMEGNKAMLEALLKWLNEKNKGENKDLVTRIFDLLDRIKEYLLSSGEPNNISQFPQAPHVENAAA